MEVTLQALVGVGVIMIALVAQTRYSPYEADTLDRLETLGLSTAALTLYGGLFLGSDSVGKGLKTVITLFIASINLVYMVRGAHLGAAARWFLSL